MPGPLFCRAGDVLDLSDRFLFTATTSSFNPKRASYFRSKSLRGKSIHPSDPKTYLTKPSRYLVWCVQGCFFCETIAQATVGQKADICEGSGCVQINRPCDRSAATQRAPLKLVRNLQSLSPDLGLKTKERFCYFLARWI